MTETMMMMTMMVMTMMMICCHFSDAVLVSVVDFTTSLMTLFSVFSVIGYAKQQSHINYTSYLQKERESPCITPHWPNSRVGSEVTLHYVTLAQQ
jgi:hypothetical protein